MNAAARPWIGLCFKLMAFLAAIIAFMFFMLMQEDQSENDKLRGQGVVSRALVVAKEKDQVVTAHSSGRRNRSSYSTTNDRWLLHIRHVPKSTVKYADFPSKVNEADLPVAPAETGDVMKDMDHGGLIVATEELYEKTKVGDVLTVVNTPWDSSYPKLVSEVEAFDPSPYYPKIAISLVLMLLFWFIGRRISKASALRGLVEVAKMPGTTP
jgi:hypothetical protein